MDKQTRSRVMAAILSFFMLTSIVSPAMAQTKEKDFIKGITDSRAENQQDDTLYKRNPEILEESADGYTNTMTDESNNTSDKNDNDGNTSISEAIAIEVGTLKNGIYDFENDEDFYSFTASDAGIYYLEFKPTFACKFEYNAYDSSGEEIQIIDNSDDFYLNCKENEKYYLKLKILGETLGQYSIGITEDRAPQAPKDLKLVKSTSSTATISWSEATDNVAVTGYEIYRDGLMIGEAGKEQLSYTDTNLISNTKYKYAIKAKDGSDNISESSEELTVEIGLDTNPPTAPTKLVVLSKTGWSISLKWEASTDDGTIAGYDIYCGENKIGSSEQTEYTAVGLSPNTEYSFKAIARDGGNNTSESSNIIIEKTHNDDIGDDINAALECRAETQVVGMYNYENDEDYFKFVSGEYGKYWFNFKPTFECDYSLNAFDGKGEPIKVNYDSDTQYIECESNETYYINLKIEGKVLGEYTINIIGENKLYGPSNLQIVSTTATTVTMTWNKDDGNHDVVGYEIYRDGNKIGSTEKEQLSYTDTNFETNGTYKYVVKSRTASGKLSKASNEITVEIDSPDIPSTKPIKLIVVSKTSSSITLNWEATEKATTYDIYCNNEKIADSTETTYKCTNLTPNTNYTFKVTVGGADINSPNSSNTITENTSAIDSDGNSSISEAVMLEVGTMKNGIYDYENDEDFYSFTTSDSGLYYFEFKPTFACTFKYNVYDSKGQEIQTNYNSDDFYLDCKENEKYYLKLKILGETLGHYSIGITEDRAPQPPKDLKLVKSTSSTATISWSEATDNVGVTSYEIYRDGLKIGEVGKDQLSYTDTNLISNTKYKYTIKAEDGSDNISESSEEITVEIGPDTEPPTVPTKLSVLSKNGWSASLKWEASTDNMGILGYEIYRDGKKIMEVGADKLSFEDISLLPGTEYIYSIKAKDILGNISESSNEIKITTREDTDAPTVPENLTVISKDGLSVTLRWRESKDDIRIKEYEIYNGEQIVATTVSPTYTVNLKENTTNYFTVKAKDIADKVSEPSEKAIVKILEEPPKTKPSYLAACSIDRKRVTLIWEDIKDNQSTSYEVYNGDKLIGRPYGSQYTVNNLNADTEYNFTVRAKESSDNLPGISLIVKTLKDIEAPTVPQNLNAIKVSACELTLTWDRAFDNTGVIGYEVYNGDELIETTTKTFIKVTGLSPKTEYNFYVKAKDEYGNMSEASLIYTIKTPGYSDLIITDINYLPSIPSEGEKVTFKATIKNIGEGPTQDGVIHKLSFSLDGQSTNIVSEKYSHSIQLGETITLRADKVWEATNGTHTIKAFIDAENIITELNDENNFCEEKMTIERPCDLTVSNILFTKGNPKVGDQIGLRAVVKNIGDGKSPAGRTHRVGFYIDDNKEAMMWTNDYEWSIEPGEYKVIAANEGKNLALWSAIEGEHKITAVIDDINQISEINETNNTFSRKIKVTKEYEYDPMEDYDGDGLSNKIEELLGTSQNNFDSDGDGISDYDEIYLYSTNPLNPDTDGDGIYDNTEIKQGTDPLIADAIKEVKRETETIDGKVKVSVMGDNNISVAPFQVVEYDNILLSSIKGIVGKPIEISLGGYEMDSGEIQFSYNEDQLNNIAEEKLTIYWLDTENKEIVPVPKDKITIDQDSNTITGIVDHFSIYFLGEENIEKDPTNVDIVFTIDQSGSMDDNDPNFIRLLGTKKFIREIDESEKNRLGIVEFESNANVVQALTNDKDILINKLDNMRKAYGSTNLGDGLLKSGQLFDSMERFKTIIFLTDGYSNAGLTNDEILGVTRAISANNIMINTIGLGSEVDSEFLQGIAGIGNGQFFHITTAGKSREQIDAEIELVYTQLAKQIALREKAPYNFNPRALLTPIDQVKRNLFYLGYIDVYYDYKVALDSFLNEYYEISSNKKVRELYEELNEKDQLIKLVEWTCNAFTSAKFKRVEKTITILNVTDKTITCNVENGTGKMLELYDITAEERSQDGPGRLINKIKLTELNKEVVFSNLTVKTRYAIVLKDEANNILAYRNVTTRENNQGTYMFVGVPKVQGVKGYILESGEQVIMGNFTDKVTLLGTAGQIGLSLTGVDFVADVRDVSADLINWEWSWGHAGQTTLDGIGLIPIIGVIKNADEVALLFRSGKNIDEVIDALDDGSKYISKQFMKEIEQAGIKYSKETTIGLIKTSSGKINWLELGNDKTGLQHIMKNYGKDFADWGLKSDEQVADVILKAISKDKGVSIGDGIKIFDINIDGSVKQLKVVTESNGLISSAQPVVKGVGKGFNTFNDAKKFLGSPGQGNQWHHIVEQSQISKSGFSPTQIQNTNNLIAVDSAKHAKISGYYSSKPEFARGKTVRDWLAGQSYEEQYKFGLDVLNRFGIK